MFRSLIRWYLSKFDSWFVKQTNDLDLSDQGLDKATIKDYWILYKVLNSPVFWLFMLPVAIIATPFALLMGILETVSAFVVIAAGVSFLISLYMILIGQGTASLVLLCIGAGIVFLVYTAGWPHMQKTRLFRSIRVATKRKIRSWFRF